MNSTPRLRSAYPTSPQTTRTSRDGRGAPIPFHPNGAPKRDASPNPSPMSQPPGPPPPVISLEVLDAAQQRLCVLGIWIALLAYRLWDFSQLMTGERFDSLWLFMKWVAIDGIFLYAIPAMCIPWLEWTSWFTTLLFILHAALDLMMMFQIGLPFGLVVEALWKWAWDRELAISERRVKAASLLDTSALILGKKVVHILPEGSALLNPLHEHFCLGTSIHSVQMPIQINQTEPILIELLRVDLGTGSNETMTIKASEAKRLRRDARNRDKHALPQDPLLLKYTIKKTGRYTIQKVIDKTNLEVRPRPSEVYVVTCPEAHIKSEKPKRCRGDLSNIAFEVTGTPPMKVKYRKTINGNPMEASFQSLQPDDSTSSALVRRNNSMAISRQVGLQDVEWARTRKITVPVNESLPAVGNYRYTLELVEDGLGNVVKYLQDVDEDEKPVAKIADDRQAVLSVEDRPIVSVDSQVCDAQRPLYVAKGAPADWPVQFKSAVATPHQYNFNEPHLVEYLFTPEDSVLSTGKHNISTQKRKHERISDKQTGLKIEEPGLYTLLSVRTATCEGDVAEPASCFLKNPPAPSASTQSEEIFDGCAGNPVGLRLRMEFTGSPPFELSYMIEQKGEKTPVHKKKTFNSLRGELELIPRVAGHYTYKFTEVSDRYYRGVKLTDSIQQDVKPLPSAFFADSLPLENICIRSKIRAEVILVGEPPWTLEYELVHGKSKKKQKASDIQNPDFHIETEPLVSGGEHILALISVTDKSGCKETLNKEFVVRVRHQQPQVSFGLLDGKRSVKTLEGKSLNLPIKLTGTSPWDLEYRQPGGDTPIYVKLHEANAAIQVREPGTYELVEVRDAFCYGYPEETTKFFSVDWIPRPVMSLPEHPTIILKDGKYIKGDVCEGDDDYVELAFEGTPPFEIKYQEHIKPVDSPKSIRARSLSAASKIASLQLETSKSGHYEYTFSHLADNNYDAQARKNAPHLTLSQRVHPRPSAQFAHPGKAYSFCSTDATTDDFIPINLTGLPPFHLEVELRHSGSTAPETLKFPNIPSQSYNLAIPAGRLRNGHSHLTIRKVRDARGCGSVIEPGPGGARTPGSRVQISVHDPPSIVALEERTDFCVGERLGFRLTGTVPFTVWYEFQGVTKKASTSSTVFKRLAEVPGNFSISAISDAASSCKYNVAGSGGGGLRKTIHALPGAKVSGGVDSVADIHEGGETDILFEFVGEPPFEFTYTRSENARGNKRGRVLETKTERADGPSKRVRASEEGTYEVVGVRDRWCAVSREGGGRGRGRKG